MSLKDSLKKIPGVGKLGRAVKYCLPELSASLDLLHERRIKRTGAIRVGFLCQYIPAWDKLEPIYRKMQADTRFQPVLICLPSGIENHKLINPESLENDTWQTMVEKGYPEAVNALVGAEQWLAPETLQLQYVFTVRPYDQLMPLPYTTRALSRHCRICLIMYGMTFAREDRDIAVNRSFMSRLYLHFADNDYIRQYRLEQHALKHRLGLQKTMCVGLPVGEMIAQGREAPRPAWDFAKGDFRIMWTPRWTTDPKVGGTNFFQYKDVLLDYAQQAQGTDLLLRPHPLMFDNFVKTGAMTEAEVSAYKAKCQALPNVAFDTEARYDATFWGSDVLVSDISGMIPEYLFTGKPLIFCRSNMQLELLEPMEQLLAGCYTVTNQQELFDCLNMLRRGEDPKAEQRKLAVEQVLGAADSPSQQILQILLQDAK